MRQQQARKKLKITHTNIYHFLLRAKNCECLTYTQFKETGSAEKQVALTTTYNIQLLSKTSSKEQKEKNKEKMKNCRKQNGKMAE